MWCWNPLVRHIGSKYCMGSARVEVSCWCSQTPEVKDSADLVKLLIYLVKLLMCHMLLGHAYVPQPCEGIATTCTHCCFVSDHPALRQTAVHQGRRLSHNIIIITCFRLFMHVLQVTAHPSCTISITTMNSVIQQLRHPY